MLLCAVFGFPALQCVEHECLLLPLYSLFLLSLSSSFGSLLSYFSSRYHWWIMAVLIKFESEYKPYSIFCFVSSFISYHWFSRLPCNTINRLPYVLSVFSLFFHLLFWGHTSQIWSYWPFTYQIFKFYAAFHAGV